MEKKKILYIITKSNLGGAQRYVLELATSLPKEHYDVAVACGGNGLLVTQLKEQGIRVFPIKNFERDINIVGEWRAFQEVYTLIKSERPDIVHVNSSKAGGIGALCARLLGVPHIIFTAHGWPFHEPRNPLWRSLAWLFSFFTVLIAHTTIVVSHFDKKYARMPFLSRRIHAIETAVPQIQFEERDVARTALFQSDLIATHATDTWVVSTGELTRNKNIEALLTSVRDLTSEGRVGIFLVIAGDGELRESLERSVHAYNIQEYVHFTGYVPEMRQFLRAFDIFVLPSLKEGLPYGLLEAGSAGLAAIGSHVGGIPEVITDGESGLLIDPHKSKTLTVALSSLIEDETKRKSYGKAIATHIHEHFSFTEMYEKTLELYVLKF